jgi:hypothetical protein
VNIPPAELDAMRTRGSILFPYNTMSNSPSQPLTDATGGKFGPFAGQMLVGEMNHPRLLRVAMEEVDGQLQGMATELLTNHGLKRGINRAAFAPDGSLWIGLTDHGWAGDKGIQRIAWTGKVPLDVKEMHLTKTGFELTFTQPVESAAASDPESYKVRHYYYEYHAAYGSPEFDAQVEVPKAVTLSEDRTKVKLEFEALVAWRIYEFHLNALKTDDGVAIANPLVAYTLNHFVGGKTPPPPPAGPGPKDESKKKLDGATAGEEPAQKVTPAPTGTPAPKATPAPTATPDPGATPTPTPKPKSRPKPKTATPSPTPAPATPTPKPGKGKATPKPATPSPTPKK